MKKIIAAALSILLGAFGYTIVDKAMEDRVATLESEVVELREEVSRHHPNYSSQTSTRRSTTNFFTTTRNTTATESIKEPTSKLYIGSYLEESPKSMHKFLLRRWEDGSIQFVSPNDYETAPTAHIFTLSPTSISDGISTTRRFESVDYYLYILESSAQIIDLVENISYSHWYDKDYSKVAAEINESVTMVKFSCKGFTDPIFANKDVCFEASIGNRWSYKHYNLYCTINSDGSFELNETIKLDGYLTDYSYSFSSICIGKNETTTNTTITFQPTTCTISTTESN